MPATKNLHNSCREQNVRHKNFHCYEKPKWYADYILNKSRAESEPYTIF